MASLANRVQGIMQFQEVNKRCPGLFTIEAMHFSELGVWTAPRD